MSKIYRHYGSSKYDPRCVNIVTRSRTIKPVGGLWACPLDSKNSWYNWCKQEYWNTDSLNTYFDFKISDETKVLQINSFQDLVNMVRSFPGRSMDNLESSLIYHKANSDYHFTKFPDYVAISKKYDAIEVSITNCPDLFSWMYGWDVDSLVIWNEEMVIPI